MPLPDGFPEWVSWIAYGVFALTLGVGMGVTRLGFLRGRKTPERVQQSDLAMVTLDSSALKLVAQAIEGLNVTMTELNELIRQELKDKSEERDEAREAEIERRGYEKARAELEAGRRPSTRKPRPA